MPASQKAHATHNDHGDGVGGVDVCGVGGLVRWREPYAALYVGALRGVDVHAASRSGGDRRRDGIVVVFACVWGGGGG